MLTLAKLAAGSDMSTEYHVKSDSARDNLIKPPADNHLTPLKIVIVGTGPGGLSVALSLRRNGHHVELFEQSRLASETAAAVHLSPNANGVLRRWGIFAETFGAVEIQRLQERDAAGRILKDVDVSTSVKQWQYPWMFSHRVNLHEKLKLLATSEAGLGPPAKLHIASKVVGVDAERGTVKLADGRSVEGDVVIGADGIYSTTRSAIKDMALFPSGKAAFRFLIPRHRGLDDPLTRPITETAGALAIWFGADRRIVMYPCNNDELLNFVCIHPETESHATKTDGWNKQADLEQVLKVYRGFDPALLALIKKVDLNTVKVWQLMDMEKLPSWISGKLALMGDAAHPFTPHQGQGAGQALEDAATLSVVLPKGTAAKDVPERLKLYEKIRYDRAHNIQEFSRQAGRDWKDGKPTVEMTAYMSYNFDHDEIENSSHAFKCWVRSQQPD